MTLVCPPLSATGYSRVLMEESLMCHNSLDLTIKQDNPIGAPLACQTTAR